MTDRATPNGIDRAFMAALHPGDRPDSEILRGPFSLRHEGSWWDCVSSGTALLMLRSTGPSFRELPESATERVLAVVDAPAPNRYRVLAGALRVWLADASIADSAPCEECQGAPPVSQACHRCNGTGICECRCGDEHDCAECEGEGNRGGCWRCDSDGTLPLEANPGSIGGGDAIVDRNLVKRFLSEVMPDNVVLDVAHGEVLHPVHFRSAGFRCCVMQYRGGNTGPALTVETV